MPGHPTLAKEEHNHRCITLSSFTVIPVPDSAQTFLMVRYYFKINFNKINDKFNKIVGEPTMRPPLEHHRDTHSTIEPREKG